MSRLAREIAVTQGRRVAVPQPMPAVKVTDSIQEIRPYEAYEYTIGAELRVRTQCLRAGISEVQARAKRHIIESVFGEFRGPIQTIYASLFEHDVRGAMAALRALEDQMFGDTE